MIAITEIEEEKPKKKKKRNPPPAPKGNKYALGNSGRPKKYDPSEEAKALIDWVNKPDSLILLKFSSQRGYCRDRFHIWEKECPEFADAYNLAKEIVACRREEFANQGLIDKSIYHRYQTTYDKYLHAFERAEKEFDASISSKATKDANQDLVEGLRGLVQDTANSS